MLLENKYYQIKSIQGNETDAVFHIAILPDCDVYRGHFPGDPVCPGVCNIETVKECAMHLTHQKMQISTIKQCRLTAIASPTVCSEMDVAIHLSPTDNGYTVTAKITDTEKVYMEYKGEMNL